MYEVWKRNAGSRFCQSCGAKIGEVDDSSHTVDNNAGRTANFFAEQILFMLSDRKTIYLILATISSIYVSLGGVFRLINLKWYGDSTSLSLLNIMTSWEDIENAVDISLGTFPFIVLLITIGAYAGCVIFCIRYILGLLSGTRGRLLVEDAKQSMSWGIVYIIFMNIMMWLINKTLAKELYDYKPFSIKKAAWVILVAAVVNLYVFLKGYLGQPIAGILSTEQLRENIRITSDKVCSRCGEHYTLGDKCPRCGSQMKR